MSISNSVDDWTQLTNDWFGPNVFRPIHMNIYLVRSLLHRILNTPLSTTNRFGTLERQLRQHPAVDKWYNILFDDSQPQFKDTSTRS